MAIAVYGVDIAVYKVGAQGKVIGRRGFAWTRIEPDSTAGALDPARLPIAEVCGHDLPGLASRMAEDMRRGLGVALGFEAPMWTPAPTELPQRGPVFEARFEEERDTGCHWYLQSGAAATLKALTLGKLLFLLLKKQGFQPVLITTERVVPDANHLVLYEAFVASDFKLDPLAGFSQDSWDACSAALAYLGTLLGRSLRGYRAVEFGPTKLIRQEIFSH